eukprot:824530-Amphidinium_carterae.1
MMTHFVGCVWNAIQSDVLTLRGSQKHGGIHLPARASQLSLVQLWHSTNGQVEGSCAGGSKNHLRAGLSCIEP